jgi:serine/threonine-protein kinase
LFQGNDPGEVVAKVLSYAIPPPSSIVGGLSPELDQVVMTGLARDPGQRYATALDMAAALETVMGLVPARDVGQWVRACAGPRLDDRAQKVAAVESSSAVIDVHGLGVAVPAVIASGSSAPISQRASEIGTGRSQVGSVVDRTSLAPKRGSRLLPFVAGAALVMIVPALLIWNARRNHETAASSAAAVMPAREVLTPALTESAAVEMKPLPAETASEAPSAAPPIASASERALAPAKLVKAPPKPGAAAKPKKPGSLYSRD